MHFRPNDCANSHIGRQIAGEGLKETLFTYLKARTDADHLHSGVNAFVGSAGSGKGNTRVKLRESIRKN
jgi:hypothetical protein